MGASDSQKITRTSLSSYNPLHSEEKTSSKPVTFYGMSIAKSPSGSYFLRKIYNSLGGLGFKAWSGIKSLLNSDHAKINSEEINKTQAEVSKQKALGNHEIAGFHAARLSALYENDKYSAEMFRLFAEAKEKLIAFGNTPDNKALKVDLEEIKQKLNQLKKVTYNHVDASSTLPVDQELESFNGGLPHFDDFSDDDKKKIFRTLESYQSATIQPIMKALQEAHQRRPSISEDDLREDDLSEKQKTASTSPNATTMNSMVVGGGNKSLSPRNSRSGSELTQQEADDGKASV